MTTPPTPSPAPRRAALAFVFITVLLDVIAVGIIIPVLPQLITALVGGDTAQAAHMVGIFGAVWALMQFIFAPALGALSDRIGRRPVILMSNFGLGLDYVLMALAPNLAWLFVGRIISGITAASISTATAYIADVTDPEQRARSFGLMGGAFGIGFVVGPAIGGMLGTWDPRLPFWGAAVLSLCNALYGLFVLPESLPPERRGPFNWRRANPIGSLGLLRTHPQLWGLGGVVFLSYLAHEVLPNVTVLYTGYRYAWGPATVGLMLTAVGIISGGTQALAVGPVVKRLGEARTVVLAMACGALGFACYGLAPTGFWYCWGLPPTALWGLGGAAVQGLMSKHVGSDAQGQLQGAVGAMRGVSGLIGPLLFTSIFAWAIGPNAPPGWPGAAYLLGAVLLLLGSGASWVVTRQSRDGAPAA